MQRFILATLLISFIVSSGCKKNAVSKSCGTAASFAGIYKITKKEFVYTGSGIVTDQTTSLMDCDLSGTYDFHADGTVTYSESDSCGGSTNGSWNISDSSFLINFSSSKGGKIEGTHIENWDCTRLVALTQYPNAVGNDRYTLTRQ